MTCHRIGRPPISTRGLGIDWVCSCRRVPRPPQRMATVSIGGRLSRGDTLARVPDLLERARARRWYHVMELAPGFTTDGWFDLRPYLSRYGLPDRLEGMRVLDVGTWDGFWAFELERRGASEVVAIDLDDERDLDWPPRRRPAEFSDAPRGEGFHLAREILGSSVQREFLSIYDATPERLGGPFDLVFCGSVLIHLRDQ